MYQSALQTVHCQSTLVKEKEEEEKWLINHGIRENDSIGSEEEQRKRYMECTMVCRIIRKLVYVRTSDSDSPFLFPFSDNIGNC